MKVAIHRKNTKESYLEVGDIISVVSSKNTKRYMVTRNSTGNYSFLNLENLLLVPWGLLDINKSFTGEKVDEKTTIAELEKYFNHRDISIVVYPADCVELLINERSGTK